MPLCRRCTRAIEEVYPQGLDTRLTQDVKVRLPILTQLDIRSCWVCLKFLKWLKFEYPSLCDDWKTKPLGVKFFHHAHIVLSTQANFPARLFVGIGLDDKYSDVDEFYVLDLALMPPKDFAIWSDAKHTIPSPGTYNFSLVKEWVDACCKSHRQCNEKKENWYPTRLLHITSGGQQVRLVISQDHAPKGHYMTLSHRWGASQYTKLLTSTMAQLQKAIAVPDLPPAFQNAITIAASLDTQYLWIDGLCIKQDPDDRTDWGIEALTMGKVYANAFLNISATLAVDGSETLFHNQGYEPFGPSEIVLRVEGKLKKFYLLDGDIWTDEISNAPLSSRGWVFQERFLARRVLHFGNRQLGWECRQSTTLEMFPKGLPANLGTPVTKSSVHTQLAKLAHHTRRSSVQDFLTIWQHIVTTYSQCTFTFGEDKLTAFAGIGARISDLAHTEFVAGMLEKSLLYDLAWWRCIEDRERSPLSDASLRAPSWSWMSVDGQINFPEDISGVSQLRSFVEDIEIIRDQGDLYGTNSRIRIRGICMPLRADWSEDVIIGFSLTEVPACRFTVDDGPRGSSIYGEVSFETLYDLVKRGRVLFLPLFSTTYFLNGILITSIRGRGLYRRIGAIQIPIMEESTVDNEKETARNITHKEQWRRDTRVTNTRFTTFYNITALRLIEYIQSSAGRNVELS